jgi:hypothetical protein
MPVMKKNVFITDTKTLGQPVRLSLSSLLLLLFNDLKAIFTLLLCG